MHGKRVLVVEDDPVGRHIFLTALQNHGYATAAAADALAALPEARKQRPDVIILDLGLPAGGGLTFLQRLKGFPALSTIPVLIVSALDRETNEEKTRQAGAVAYLQKPVSGQEVVAAVDRILGHSAQEFTE